MLSQRGHDARDAQDAQDGPAAGAPCRVRKNGWLGRSVGWMPRSVGPRQTRCSERKKVRGLRRESNAKNGKNEYLPT